eukprot:TRINITY_DN4148_c0_g2_i3.p1 TRINITY_DN4148_c0_g2~~TRINITY_DN4148_c0_g2_i3.p1  ORF type:complete len:208 (+),score=-18.86 TRINITY_DN4148_c0_g2_i3:510-1133(+)
MRTRLNQALKHAFIGPSFQLERKLGSNSFRSSFRTKSFQIPPQVRTETTLHGSNKIREHFVIYCYGICPRLTHTLYRLYLYASKLVPLCKVLSQCEVFICNTTSQKFDQGTPLQNMYSALQKFHYLTQNQLHLVKIYWYSIISNHIYVNCTFKQEINRGTVEYLQMIISMQKITNNNNIYLLQDSKNLRKKFNFMGGNNATGLFYLI